MKSLSGVELLSLVLVIVGGLNWGLVGLAKFDLVAELFGSMSVIARIIYTLIGLSAIYLAIISMKLAKR